MRIELAETFGQAEGSFSFGDDDPPLPLAKVDSRKLTEALRAPRKPKMGLLPPAVRWISAEKDFCVFERPPCYKTISYSAAPQVSAHTVPDNTHVIPIPWTVYHVQFNQDFLPIKIRVFTRPEPLTSLTNKVYLLPMLNFYSNGLLCNPVYGQYEAYEPTLQNGINAAYNMVWNSGFNFDLRDAITQIAVQNKPWNFIGASNMTATRMIQQLYRRWERAPLSDTLTMKWPRPALLMGSDPDEAVTLLSVIEVARVEAYSEAKRGGNEFMVNLVNTINYVNSMS